MCFPIVFLCFATMKKSKIPHVSYESQGKEKCQGLDVPWFFEGFFLTVFWNFPREADEEEKRHDSKI